MNDLDFKNWPNLTWDCIIVWAYSILTLKIHLYYVWYDIKTSMHKKCVRRQTFNHKHALNLK